MSSLCRRKSNRIKGDPFCPVMAVPVDLFPHTPHCEMVMLLEREGTQRAGGERTVGVVEGEEGGVVKEEGKPVT